MLIANPILMLLCLWGRKIYIFEAIIYLQNLLIRSKITKYKCICDFFKFENRKEIWVMSQSKLNVCVVFGGQSSEHEVSCISAASVIENLDKTKYDITALGITKEGEWYIYSGDILNIKEDLWYNDKDNLCPALISPSPKDGGLLVFNNGNYKIKKIDVVFPVLHGIYGEDGTIQGLLELACIKYVGCGVLASAVGMNKIYSKIIFDNAGLKQAKWISINKDELVNIEGIENKVEYQLGFPCYIKPANAGSSVGISKVKSKKELKEALFKASEHDRQIVVEEEIIGREIECAVLGISEPIASGVGEIVTGVEFYDYEEKYKTNTAKLIINADLSDGIKEQIQKNAVTAFKAIDGAGMARVDFFVRGREVLINEINTIPGFTAISMYPKLWQAAGLEYGELLDKLIKLSITRQK